MKSIIIKNTGFSLVEVLISLTLISFGLLGLVDAQLVAMWRSQDIYLQKLAINQISDLAEQLRVNKAVSAREQTIESWQNKIKETFPEGSAEILADKLKYRVTIKWSDDPQIITTNNRAMSADIYI